jgi:hypothetical protein
VRSTGPSTIATVETIDVDAHIVHAVVTAKWSEAEQGHVVVDAFVVSGTDAVGLVPDADIPAR